MKTTLKLVAVGLVMFGMSNAASAFVITYKLTQLPGDTWTLQAKTDAPGGIASAVVDLENATAGTSVAPRSTFGGVPFSGFTLGNIFAAQQAFTGQNTSSAGSVVYGVGFADVANAAFGSPPFDMVGSGMRDPEGYVTLYNGTGLATYKAQQPTAFGAVFGSAGTSTQVGPVVGAGPNLTAERIFVPIPEPGTIVLLGLAVPALAFAMRRRKA